MTCSISDGTKHDPPTDLQRQGRIGLLLAGSLLTAWLTLHIGLLFFFPLTASTVPAALVLVAIQTWLYVGLFIVAHDAMHGSLAPSRPSLNRRIGRLCLFLYVGFSFDTINRAHHHHHHHPGTAADPDFHDTPPHAFWPWFAGFFRTYFSWKQVGFIGLAYLLYVPVLGAAPINAMVFWALPGLLSAMQLFAFGTFLPHRPTPGAFADHHNARTNDYPVWLSLLTCFHFGYHHEHHLYPSVPWWGLPAARRGSRTSANRMNVNQT